MIDDRDAVLFNAAEQMTTACQSDFMAVGGGIALDQRSVSIREKCRLGQITGMSSRTLPIWPHCKSTRVASTGFGHLRMVRGACQGLPEGGQARWHGRGQHSLHPPARNEGRVGAEAQGWHVVDFLSPRSRWKTGRHVEDYQSKGSRPDGRPTPPTSLLSRRR